MERGRASSGKEVQKIKSPPGGNNTKSWCIGRVNSQPDKQGWLFKRGRRNRKAWKKRWFILHFNALAYFDRQGAREVRGIIPLEDAVVEEDSDSITGFRFTFGLFTIGRDFFIRGTNETEILGWLVAINRSIQMYKSAAISSPKNTKQQRKLWLANLKENFRVHSLLQMSGELEAIPRIQIFGVELEEVLKNDGERRIPFICEKMFNYIENKALHTPGIFRVSGDQEETNHLREAFELGENVDLFAIENVHSVAGLLKLFFRELPNPLATYDLFNDFLSVTSLQSDREKLKALQVVTDKLPKPNWYLMKELFTVLSHISEFSDVNQMTTSNLAIVFAPTLFKQSADDALASLTYTPYTITIAKLMIEYFNQIFRIENSNPRRSTIVSQSFLLPLKYLPDEKEIEELKKLPPNENKAISNSNNGIGMTTEELFELFRSQYQTTQKNNSMVTKMAPAVGVTPKKVKPPRPPRPTDASLQSKSNNLPNSASKEKPAGLNANQSIPPLKPLRTSPIHQSDHHSHSPPTTGDQLNNSNIPTATQDDNSDKFSQFKKRPTPPLRHVHNSDSVVVHRKENLKNIDKTSITQLQKEIFSYDHITDEVDDFEEDESHDSDDSDHETNEVVIDDDQSLEVENQISDCLLMANFLLNELHHDNIHVNIPQKANLRSIMENADLFLSFVGR